MKFTQCNFIIQQHLNPSSVTKSSHGPKLTQPHESNFAMDQWHLSNALLSKQHEWIMQVVESNQTVDILNCKCFVTTFGQRESCVEMESSHGRELERWN